MSNAEPLWKLMREAYKESSGTIIVCDEKILPGPCRDEFAAMIRAVAKWVEERTAATATFTPDMPTVWHIIGMLLAEADRAETFEW